MECVLVMVGIMLVCAFWTAISRSSEAARRAGDAEQANKLAQNRLNALERKMLEMEQRLNRIGEPPSAQDDAIHASAAPTARPARPTPAVNPAPQAQPEAPTLAQSLIKARLEAARISPPPIPAPKSPATFDPLVAPLAPAPMKIEPEVTDAHPSRVVAPQPDASVKAYEINAPQGNPISPETPSPATPPALPIAGVTKTVLPPLPTPGMPQIPAAATPPTPKPAKPLAPAKNPAQASARPDPRPVLQPRKPAAPKPAPTPISWERAFTNALPWLGAIALGLAGVFGVKVMSDHHLLSPAVRVIAVVVFGLGLIGFAQWFRAKSGRIAEAMAAAGVLTLYAAVLACKVLYGSDPTIGIDANTAFVGLALVTASAVALSLRHGQMVALLGLLGGFLTPAMLSTGKRPDSSFFLYLICLEVGLTLLSKGRRWWWITLLAMVGGLGWAGLWIACFFDPTQAHWVAGFLLASIVAFVVASVRTDPKERVAGLSIATIIPWTAVVVGMLMVATLLRQSNFSTIEWVMFGVLGAGTIVLARLRERYFPLTIFAGILTVGMLLSRGLTYDAKIDEVVALGWTTLALGLVYTIGAYACLWRSKRPVAWIALSIGSSFVFTYLGYHFVSGQITSMNPPWWAIIAGVGILHAFAAIPIQTQREFLDHGDDMLCGSIVAVTGFTSWALVLFIGQYELGPHWIAIAWSLEVAALAGCALWLKLPRLHKVIGPAAAVVVLLLVANPRVLHYSYGEGLIAWWLLYGYGLPAAAFVGAAWCVRKQKDEPMATFLEAASASFVLVMFTLGIRHAFHPEALTEESFGLSEIGSYTAAWVIMGLFMVSMASRWPQAAVQIGARVVFFLGLFIVLVGAGLFRNPLWVEQNVGSSILFNDLLFAYGVPAFLAGIAAWLFAKRGDLSTARVAMAASVLLLILCGGLMVHHGFHLEHMNVPDISLYEQATLSVVWLDVAIALLLIGSHRKKQVLVHGGLAVMGLGLFAGVVGTCVLANPLWHPTVMSTLIVLNPLLYIYGVPMLLAGLAGWLLRRSDHELGGQIATWSAALLGYVLIFMETHHAFHGGDLSANQYPLSEMATLAIVWALAGLGIMEFARTNSSPIVRPIGTVGMFLGLFASIVGTLILANPLWSTQELGEVPIVNGLLYAYGAPMLLSLAAAWLLKRRDEAIPAEVGFVYACVLGVVLSGLEIHHGFHGGQIQSINLELVELATYGIIWGLGAAGLIGLGRARESALMQTLGDVLAGLSLVTMTIGTLIVGNPLIRHEDVGGAPVVNWILYSYGLTTALAVLAAWDAAMQKKETFSRISRGVSLVMGFAFLTLEVRQGFQGRFLDAGSPSNAEWYAYSAAWILFAGVLLSIGLMTRSKVLRLASMTVMFAAVLKVFLFDTRQLQDEWRVLSYFGLGVSLLALAWVYQKYVFGGGKTAEPNEGIVDPIEPILEPEGDAAQLDEEK